jgi:hypothetical protein
VLRAHRDRYAGHAAGRGARPRGLVVRALLVCGALAGLAGCGDATDMGGRPGDGLGGGGGGGRPECGALGQVCLRAGLDAPMAAGSSVELIIDFTLSGSTGPAVSLHAADPTVLVVDGNEVAAAAEGMSGLLFVGEDDVVLDFLHVWVARPDELRLLAYSRQGDLLGRVQDRVTLLVGDEVLVSVEPFKAAQPLLGNFRLERELTGEAVIVVPDAVGGLYRVVARSVGTATVTLRGLGLETSWAIEVLP